MVLGGVVSVVVALFFSFRDLGESDEQAVNYPAFSRVNKQTSSQADAPASSLPEPAVDSFAAQVVSDAKIDSAASPGLDPVPLVGSEASVPAVYGLLTDPNITDLPVAEGLQGIAEEFAERVKQGGWDTTSEAYRTNWEQAAQEADDLLRARYGTEIFLKLKQNAAP